jgi:hypothetical protein
MLMFGFWAMTEYEHRILYALEHPASVYAVSRTGIEWDGQEQTSELLDWSDIVFAMWRAGLLSPGPTIGRASYWVLRAGWRSSAAMRDAVAPLVGPGWVEAVRRRVLRDAVIGPSIGSPLYDSGGGTDWKFRHVFCAPGSAALSAQLRSNAGHVPLRRPVDALVDDSLMNEIRAALASYRGTSRSESDLNRARSLSAALRSPARLLQADAEVQAAVAHVNDLVRLAAQRAGRTEGMGRK